MRRNSRARLRKRKRDSTRRSTPNYDAPSWKGCSSQLDDLKRELYEYETLRSGKRRFIALESIEELPKTLIQARIAAGLSQEELAARLGLKPQQIQRYEATNYQSASLERVNEIMRTLGVRLRHRAELRLVS